MIKFNTNDYNLTKIKKHSKLDDVKTYHDFKVIGLKDGADAPITINYSATNTPLIAGSAFELASFFKKNEIPVKVDWEKNMGAKEITIGLTKELREHVVLSSCILTTIIYKLEKKIDVDVDFKIAGIPHLS